MNTNFKFNLLIDELPSTVEVDGSSFSINTDFRYGLLFNICINDEEMSSFEKCNQLLSIGYKDKIPEDYNEAIKKLVSFYMCFDLDNKDIDKVLEEDNKNEDEQNEQEDKENYDEYLDNPDDIVFDYEKDAFLIYSTFKQVYNIDLIDENMHWYKFVVLLRGLFDENNLTKVLQYRAMKIDSKMPADMRKHYRELKKHYSLNRKTTEEMKEYKRKMLEEWG